MSEPTKIEPATAEATAESLDRLTVLSERRSLVRAAQQYYKLAQTYSPTSATRAEVNAYVGLLMASTYAYSLASALRIMGEEMGPEAAADAAVNLEDIVVNGDDGDTNEDVTPDGLAVAPGSLAGADNDDRRIAADMIYARFGDQLGPEWVRGAVLYGAAELLDWEKAADQSPARAARIEALALTGDLNITFAADPPLRDLRSRAAELEKEVRALRREVAAFRAHNAAATSGCGHGPNERCLDCASEAEILAAIPPHGDHGVAP